LFGLLVRIRHGKVADYREKAALGMAQRYAKQERSREAAKATRLHFAFG